MKQIFSSDNAVVSFITILLGALFALLQNDGLVVPDDSGAIIVDAVSKLDLVKILTVVIPNIVLPTFKFVRNGFPNFWQVFKESANFRTQLSIAFVGILGLLGVGFSATGINAFADQIAALTGLSIGSIISLVAALLSSFNSGIHIAATKKAAAG